MTNPIKVGVVILLFLYPFLIYFGLNYFKPAQLGLFFLVLFAIRLIVTKTKNKTARWQLIIAVMLGGTLASLTWIFDSKEFLMWYPVGMSSIFFIIFTRSIFYPPSVIEQMGRMYNDNFTEAAEIYTRRVTMIWSVFFAINIVIASWTVLHGDMKIWTLYNGLISYFIVGILVGGEILVRKFIIKK